MLTYNASQFIEHQCRINVCV